jgi:predicted nucleotidyltransferase
MLKADIDKIVKIATEQIPSVQAVYLFGSHASGMSSSSSDVDIAFFTAFECQADSVLIHQVQMRLEMALGKEVDFIHLNVKNASLILQYETLVLSMYQRLQEERKDILDEIISSGKVYA